MLRPFLLATLTVPFSWVEAWLTMQSTLHPEVKTYPTQRSTTRWDKHLDLAKSAYRRRHWGQVRQICSRVINVSAASHEVAACQDWAAVEQAHLRLALAEQQDKQVDAARRTFQRGTTACPSSDTLFMAWALMESKIHNARSRKVARALLRRAVSLNPKRHSGVLKWRVFLDWKDVSDAALKAMRMAIENGQQAMSVTISASAVTPAATLATTAEPASTCSTSTAAGVTTSTTNNQALTVDASMGTENSGEMMTSTAGSNGRSKTKRNSSQSSAPSSDFLTRWAKRRAAEKERALSAELVTLCRAATEAIHGSTANARLTSGSILARNLHDPSETRLQEVISALESRGRGMIRGGNGRVLRGSWRLAYTTCSVCRRLLIREGLDFYQHLCSPIQDIVPRPGEPPVPLRCEVIVTPSFFPSSGSTSSRSSVSHFLRGWAQARVSRETGRVSLRQQVAPRKSARLSARNGADSLSDQDPAPLPPAMLHALGNVARGGGGLEKLVTQEVTYMGGRLRIGRTKDGDVFVYERCMWPRDRL